MAINTIKATMQMRRGREEDFDPDQMTAGEWAVSTDMKYVRMCFMPGLCLRMATYEAFEEDMKKIQDILVNCEDIQTAVEEWAKLTEKHKNDVADMARMSESWAVGGTGTRLGEDTDNSKYYSEQAKKEADRAAAIANFDIDSELSETSANPVQNRVITEALNKHKDGLSQLEADKLYAKKGIYDDTLLSMNRNGFYGIGANSIAWGENNMEAKGDNSIAIGGTKANAEGINSAVIGGSNNSAKANLSTILNGENNKITDDTGVNSIVGGGNNNELSGGNSIIFGGNNNKIISSKRATVIGGSESTLENSPDSVIIGGYNNKAIGKGYTSIICGHGITGLAYAMITGHYNDSAVGGDGKKEGTGTGTAFVIGNGVYSKGSNAIRADYNGKLWCKSSYSSTGADYAELFEWEDGNLDEEKRFGYFVTMIGKKIKKANHGDWILGIVSANPCVLGNSDMEWQGQFLRDEFGAFIIDHHKETITETEIVEDEETGETITQKVPKEIEYDFYRVNPDYDPNQEYIDRASRPEWDAVGMMGVLSVWDDGSCEVDRFCTCSDGGIATASDTGYRVIERVAENLIKVVMK